jgi:uncharacterized protein YoxC
MLSAVDLLQDQADMLRQENKRLREVEDEAGRLASQVKIMGNENEQMRKKLGKVVGEEQVKERENQELHEDNYDLSQTVQRLKEEIEKIEQEMESGESESRLIRFNAN